MSLRSMCASRARIAKQRLVRSLLAIARASALPYGRGVLASGEAAAVFKSKGASGT